MSSKCKNLYASQIGRKLSFDPYKPRSSDHSSRQNTSYRHPIIVIGLNAGIFCFSFFSLLANTNTLSILIILLHPRFDVKRIHSPLLLSIQRFRSISRLDWSNLRFMISFRHAIISTRNRSEKPFVKNPVNRARFHASLIHGRKHTKYKQFNRVVLLFARTEFTRKKFNVTFCEEIKFFDIHYFLNVYRSSIN